MATLRQRSWYSGAVTGALGLAVAPSLLKPLVGGGLAPLAIAAVIAGLIGIPLARAESRDRAEPKSRMDWLSHGLGEVVLASWLVSVTFAASPGWAGAGLCAGIWLGAWALVSLRADIAVIGLVGLCVLQAALATGLGALEAAPWTLLEPQWMAWHQWLPWSLVSGLLMAGAGLAHWQRRPTPPPGTGHVPWLPAGIALVLCVGTACRAGSRFEADLGLLADPMALGVAVLALGAAAGSSLTASTRPAGLVGMVVVLGLWLAVAGDASVQWLQTVWLPAGVGAILSWRAWRSVGSARVIAGVGGLLAGAAVVVGWPGVPESPPDAVTAALTGAGLLWIAGTRALLEVR